MKKQIPREHEIQSVILEYLALMKIKAWRQNTGATKIGDRYIRFGKKGISDILGILPSGKFLAVEVKREGNKPTPEQQEFIDDINRNNGLAFVATSLEDVMAKIR